MVSSSAVEGRLDHRSWHNGSLDLAMGPRGKLYAAWTEYEGRLWVTRSMDGEESFSEPTLVAGAEPDDPARGPSLAVDRQGRILLAWTVGVAFTRSPDGGEVFLPGAVVPGTAEPDAGFNGSLHGLLMQKLAVNDEGDVAVVHSTFDPGKESRETLFLGIGSHVR